MKTIPKLALRAIIGATLGATLLNAANSNHKSGVVTEVGLSQMYMFFKNQVAKAHINPTMLHSSFGYTFDSGSYIRLDADVAAGHGNAYGKSFFQGADGLDKLDLRGVTTLFFDVPLLFGYNIGSFDNPFIIESGLSINNIILATIGSVSSVSFSFVIPLSLKGMSDINDRLSFEYGFGVDVRAGLLGIFTPFADTVHRGIEIDGTIYGFGINLNVGLSYAINDNVSMYGKIFSKYIYSSKSNSATVTNKAVIDRNEAANANASANIFFPSSHTFMVGLEVGFRY